MTYNLYLVDPTPDMEVAVVTPSFKGVSNLQATLQRSFKSPEFLPDGGTPGFALAHLYPVDFETELKEMAGYLKGADADVYEACQELLLLPKLRVIYDDKWESYLGIMLDTITPVFYDPNLESYEGTLVKELGGVPVNQTDDAKVNDSRWVQEGEAEGEFITWISPPNERNRLQDINVALGNDVSKEFIYCSPCITVDVPAASDRT